MFTIILPLDTGRLEHFLNTKRVYDEMDFKKEFLIPTRYEDEVRQFLEENDLMRDVKLLPYTVDKGFNCSKALNLGVRNAKYDTIIITCPEVKPLTAVLEQLSKCIGENVVCQVHDEDVDKSIKLSLVNTGFRQQTPGMYFLAMFNKKDIEKINGWDEDFMHGYAWEDSDFGRRWVRAEIPFTIRDDIEALHQWHPRAETIEGGEQVNLAKYISNNDNNVIRCKNGLLTLT